MTESRIEENGVRNGARTAESASSDQSRAREQAEIPQWLMAEVAQYDLDLDPPPASILDIGANIGAFALWAHKKWPRARIECFEPVAENFQALVKNLESIGHLIDIQLVQGAVRSFNGPGAIMIGDMPVTCGFHDLGRQTAMREEVNCIDARQIASAEFVKIDTEGCEVEILEHLDLSKTRALVVEIHRLEDTDKVLKIMRAAGLDHVPNSGNVFKFRRPQDHRETIPPLPAGEGRGEGESSKRNGRSNMEGAPHTRVPVAEFQSLRNIYLAVASHYSSYDEMFLKSMMALMQNPPRLVIQFGFHHDPSVERSRNILTANFLESNASKILFIDSDIIFTPRDVERITSHDVDIVGGCYPIKSQDREVRWCGNGTHQIGEPQAPIRPDGLQEVGCIGTGFMCISRRVFEKMAELDPNLAYVQDFPPHRKEHAFWQQRVAVVGSRRRFLTEDWNFCFTWRQLGGKVYADMNVMLRHAGRAVWPLELQQGNPFVQQSPVGPVPSPGAPQK